MPTNKQELFISLSFHGHKSHSLKAMRIVSFEILKIRLIKAKDCYRQTNVPTTSTDSRHECAWVDFCVSHHSTRKSVLFHQVIRISEMNTPNWIECCERIWMDYCQLVLSEFVGVGNLTNHIHESLKGNYSHIHEDFMDFIFHSKSY